MIKTEFNISSESFSLGSKLPDEESLFKQPIIFLSP